MVPTPHRDQVVPGSRPAREPIGRFPSSEVVPTPGNHPGTTASPGGSQVPPPYGRDQGTGGPACVKGTNGRRLLPGRHQASCEDPSCQGCEPCGADHCQVCRRRHHHPTCPTCLAVAREDLGAIGVLVEELPHQAINGRQAFHHHHGIPGGDALVLLTPAAPHRPIGDTRPIYAEPGDPRPPLDVLNYWANRWRAQLHHPDPHPPTMARVLDHLDAQLHAIADEPLFTQLARDLAKVRANLENVLHAGVRPDLSRVPCLACGTRLTKVWAETEERDHWRCPACRELYDHGRYERAKHDQLASRGADRFVPLADAIAVTERPEETVRKWLRRGQVAARRDQGTGRLLVWWPHVRELHRITPTRRRRRSQ